MVAKLKRTQMRELYVALGSKYLKQSEQLALARSHADNVSMLFHRIRNDLRTVASYPSLESTALVDADRKELPSSIDLEDLRSTPEFAAALKSGNGTHEVPLDLRLSFSYVDRETHCLRGLPEAQFERRYMDLLLLSSDGRPILGELKLGADNLPYYALVQLLMHFVELSSPQQRRRLIPLGVPRAAATRPFDLYLLAYGDPHKTYGEESLAATQAIATALMSHPRTPLRGHVRRIAYLKATPASGKLRIAPIFVAE